MFKNVVITTVLHVHSARWCAPWLIWAHHRKVLLVLPEEIDLQPPARHFFFSLTHRKKPRSQASTFHPRTPSLWASGQRGWMAATVISSILMFPLHGALFHYKNWLEMMWKFVSAKYSSQNKSLHLSNFPNSNTWFLQWDESRGLNQKASVLLLSARKQNAFCRKE